MDKEELPPGHRRLTGELYTLEEFRKMYGLEEKEAAKLFRNFGPSKIELDLFMKARQNPSSFIP
ncbi:MAG: hypothetical protein QHC90_04230 [Shinella sp.]|nr:hypothetical protein [Shinella sp.]